MGGALDPQTVWRFYSEGVEYKLQIGLYSDAARNERFFAGDQWAGINAPDLPKPVVNFIKRACQQRVAEVRGNQVKVVFTPVDMPAGIRSGASDTDTELLNALYEIAWDNMHMDAHNLDGLLGACVSGDYLLYSYWDCEIMPGRTFKGGIRAQCVDNTNYYPGDPYLCDVQSQPYILFARRERLSDVSTQIKRYHGSGTALPDRDTLYQSGDMSRLELEGPENAKCLTLTYLYRDLKSGHIMAQKTARDTVIRPLWDTRLTRYPVAMMNWETRRNCCHGRAEVTGLIPVQRYINQMYAMAMLFTMQSSCPKAVFNQGMVSAWSNAIGTAIPVNGDINAAVKYLEPPALPQDIYSLPERLMRTTLEMVGVTDLALGKADTQNATALSIARQASLLPVESVRTRFYAMMEDFAKNWLDMLFAYHTVPGRMVSANGKTIEFDSGRLKKRLWNVRVNAGPSSAISEAGAVSALKGLFNAGMINARQFIERLPDGYIPMREKLLSELGSQGTATGKAGAVNDMETGNTEN